MYHPISKSSSYFKERDAVTGKHIRNESKIAKAKALSKAKKPGIPGVKYSKRDWKELGENNKLHRATKFREDKNNGSK